jgi:NRPS condensation-like uncharacterized protein
MIPSGTVPPGDRRGFSILDELNCYFDSRAEPNNVHVEIWLPGHLDADMLRAAVTATLAAQPRAGARRADGRWWRSGYEWEFPAAADADPVSTGYWRTEAELDRARERFLATAPPVDRSPPFRLLLARGPGRDSVILNAHHAAFDGRSCLRLLRLIADRYPATERVSQPPSKWAVPTLSGASSSVFVPGGSRLPRWLPEWLPRWRTVRIAARRSDGRRAGYGFVPLGWPGVPVTPGVTVNDVLIAALIRAIERWNDSARRRPGRIRISMPLDARAPGRDDELGNLSRLCTVTADRPGASLTTVGLTTVVADQTSRAKHQPGPPVGPALAAAARAPVPTGIKRRAVRLALRCLGWLECDTSLLSNLGNVTDPPRFGRLFPERMWFSTTAHMPRGLSVGAITVAGRLDLCFRYRRALLDEAAAREFVAGYAAALNELGDSR